MAGFIPDRVAVLTQGQAVGLTPDRAAVLTQAQVAGLTPDRAAVLTQAQVAGLTPDRAAVLTQVQAAALTRGLGGLVTPARAASTLIRGIDRLPTAIDPLNRVAKGRASVPSLVGTHSTVPTAGIAAEGVPCPSRRSASAIYKTPWVPARAIGHSWQRADCQQPASDLLDGHPASGKFR